MELYGRRKVLDGEGEERGEVVVDGGRRRKAGSLGFKAVKRTERRDEGGAYGRR